MAQDFGEEGALMFGFTPYLHVYVCMHIYIYVHKYTHTEPLCVYVCIYVEACLCIDLVC